MKMLSLLDKFVSFLVIASDLHSEWSHCILTLCDGCFSGDSNVSYNLKFDS